MAHTIEEMFEAKQRLREEIADKLLEFEQDYNVRISYVDYERRDIYSEGYDNPYIGIPNFKIDIKL